ncbi:MAG: hypothetical protein JJU46_09645, partial [Balneolaceae bacterium]|nr:hypothetical protein [Balneolaceae bacterium]
LNALSENGVLTAQTESPWVESYYPSMRKVFGALKELFPVSEMYLSYIPLYPAGMWSMACATRGIDPMSEEVEKRIEKGSAITNSLRYYNRDVHKGAFALPGFVRDIIE